MNDPAIEKNMGAEHGMVLRTAMERLVQLSVQKKYSAYTEFDWPDSLPKDAFWMGPELLTVAGTPHADVMSRDQLLRLSKWESIHFYSLVLQGERDLNEVVIRHIHQPGFEEVSEFFHHFIEEENQHMWFFHQFCTRYGGKCYPQRAIRFSQFSEPEVCSYLAFSKIMIFEEIGDYFNVRIQRDERVPEFIRFMNKMHHQDEARHLAMARKLLCVLYKKMADRVPAGMLIDVEQYLKRYMRASVESFYSPAAYKDAGLDNGYQMRSELLRHPARMVFHKKVLAKVMKFYCDANLLTSEEMEYA